MTEVRVWHDEATRWHQNGHLDPPNQCLCADCMAPAADLRVPTEDGDTP